MDTSLAEPQPISATPPREAVQRDAPFRHGPFLVDADGGLYPEGRPALRFAWRGRGVEAWLQDGKVTLSASAGAMPYTAERRAGRPAALAAIDALPRELPPGWRLRVSPDHRLRVEAERSLPAPTTAIALVGAMVGFALALDPYLDRLESAGVVADGTVKIWPG